jgi:hypothetical protein
MISAPNPLGSWVARLERHLSVGSLIAGTRARDLTKRYRAPANPGFRLFQDWYANPLNDLRNPRVAAKRSKQVGVLS